MRVAVSRQRDNEMSAVARYQGHAVQPQPAASVTFAINIVLQVQIDPQTLLLMQRQQLQYELDVARYNF